MVGSRDSGIVLHLSLNQPGIVIDFLSTRTKLAEPNDC